jgi:hypothetical protein
VPAHAGCSLKQCPKTENGRAANRERSRPAALPHERSSRSRRLSVSLPPDSGRLFRENGKAVPIC